MRTEMNLRNNANKKQDTKEHLLCDSVYVNFLKREVFSDKYWVQGQCWRQTERKSGGGWRYSLSYFWWWFHECIQLVKIH